MTWYDRKVTSADIGDGEVAGEDLTTELETLVTMNALLQSGDEHSFPRSRLVADAIPLNTTWTMGLPGVSGVGTDAFGGNIAGCDQELDLTATEQVAALAVVYDVAGSTPAYQLLSASDTGDGYTNDYQLFPNTPAENDAVYFGGAVPFCEIQVLVAGPEAAAGYNANSLTWEFYHNTGVWAVITPFYDYTDSTAQDGKKSFQRDGAVVFSPPTGWAKTTVNSTEAYWIRARCSAVVDFSAVPITDAKEHLVVTPTDGFKCPEAGTIVGIRLVNTNATAHTTADIIFFLHNFTTGVRSDELTFAMDKRSDRWDSTAFKTGGLAVAVGDILGAVVTTEDTGNELTNCTIEMDVDLT